MGKNFDGVRKLGNLNGMKNQQMINGHGGSLNTDSTISDSISSTPPLINDTNQRMSPKILTATSMEPANTKVFSNTNSFIFCFMLFVLCFLLFLNIFIYKN